MVPRPSSYLCLRPESYPLFGMLDHPVIIWVDGVADEAEDEFVLGVTDGLFACCAMADIIEFINIGIIACMC